MSKQELKVPQDSAYEMEEDYSLKTMMGGDAGMARIFSQENIERGQKVINQARDDFFVNRLAALTQLRDEIYTGLGALGTMGPSQMNKVYQHVSSLSSQADLLKFSFIHTICKHIEKLCVAPQEQGLNYTHLIRDLIDVLRLALQQKITDENSKTGKEVFASLSAVSARINSSNAG